MTLASNAQARPSRFTGVGYLNRLLAISASAVFLAACIAIGNPVGMYTTVVFSTGGRPFEATAPGRD